MKYLLDTNTIIRYFAQIGEIGKSARKILTEAENNEHELIISVISLMEIMFLAVKNRIPVQLTETIKLIDTKVNYSICDLTVNILMIAKELDFYELHDRLILATAKFLNIPIISSDSKFQSIKEVQTIWQ
jgi:PIN domain nuclease of toxin-antitoxin system